MAFDLDSARPVGDIMPPGFDVESAKPAPMTGVDPDTWLSKSWEVGLPGVGTVDTGLKMPPWVATLLTATGKGIKRMGQGANAVVLPAMIPGLDTSGIGREVAEEDAGYKPLAEKHPVLTTIGEALPMAATGSPVAGAVMAATEYGTPQERALRALTAWLGGKAGEAIGSGAARMFGPKSMAGEAGAGAAFNVPTTMAQGEDASGLARWLWNQSTSRMGGKGVAEKAADATTQGFRKAVTSTFGDTSGDLSPQALGAAKNTIGKQIGDISERNTLQIGNKTVNAIDQLANDAAQDLTPEEQRIFAAQVKKIWSVANPDNAEPGMLASMSGKQYRAWDTDLPSRGGTFDNYIGKLRRAMADALDDSISTADSDAWKTARRQYHNLNVVAEATKNSPDSVSPGKLLAAVNREQDNAKFGGGTDLAKLANWAVPIIGDVPVAGRAARAPAGDFGIMGFLDRLPLAVPSYAAARMVGGKPLGPTARAVLEYLGEFAGQTGAQGAQRSQALGLQ